MLLVNHSLFIVLYEIKSHHAFWLSVVVRRLFFLEER